MMPRALFESTTAEPPAPNRLLDLFIPGIPKPQPRARAFALKTDDGKYVARNKISGTAEGWKDVIARELKPVIPWEPLECPVAMELEFYLPRPQDLMRKRDPEGPVPHTKAGDIDNFIKAVMDCLTQLGLWHDDKQVFRVSAAKYFAAKHGRTGMRIVVEAL